VQSAPLLRVFIWPWDYCSFRAEMEGAESLAGIYAGRVFTGMRAMAKIDEGTGRTLYDASLRQTGNTHSQREGL
jgi:hypothetical protein